MLAAPHGNSLTHEIEIVGVGEDADIQESVVYACFGGRDQASTVASNIADNEDEKFYLMGGTVNCDPGLMGGFSIAS